jgi:hypothetical protein
MDTRTVVKFGFGKQGRFHLIAAVQENSSLVVTACGVKRDTAAHTTQGMVAEVQAHAPQALCPECMGKAPAKVVAVKVAKPIVLPAYLAEMIADQEWRADMNDKIDAAARLGAWS